MAELEAVPEDMVVRWVEREADRVCVSLALGDEEHHLRFAASEEIGRETDFLLPATMLPAMRAGARLNLPGALSPRLLSAASKIQDVLCLWDDERFRRAPVEAAARNAPPEYRASGVACFFSGGVDSFYTLLKRREEITHLIFMELPLLGPSVQAQASRAAHEVAEELGKTLIEIETNLFWVGKNTQLPWSYYHGARMAAVGLLFQHKFGKVLVPSSFDYANLFPWGSHPLLDPLWSTESTDFEHDGCEATRPEKVALIAENDAAMKWLRVCFKDPNAYNCGRCEKCIRTMVNLRAAGALERCETLPHDLSPEAVAAADLHGEVGRAFARQNLKALQRSGTEPELIRALTEALEKDQEAGDRPEDHSKLPRLRERLQRTRAKLAGAREEADELRARNKELAESNARLTARYSERRYELMDALWSVALRTPLLGGLLRDKGS